MYLAMILFKKCIFLLKDLFALLNLRLMHVYHVAMDSKEKVTPIAITNWRDIRQQFGIKQKNRRGHMYIIGKTGTGKSNLIANMAISDIENNYGIALIDPHGDLAEILLSSIPPNRKNDVIYLNSADDEFPVAFNPLDQRFLKDANLIVSSLISVFKKIWSEFWGPRLEHVLRNALYSLMEYPNSTLLDIPALLTNKDFRKEVCMYITNQQVLDFWNNEFDKYSARLRADATSPVLNKIGQFLTNPILRNIIGQKKNSFQIRQVMDEGKILIVNLAKGKIGEDNCSLLGALIATIINLSALSRADIDEDKRRGFYLYVDEFHNFLTLSFTTALSESRKYGLNIVLANQYLGQLQEKIRDSIFGNIGTLISFRVGLVDAQYLSKEFDNHFCENDFIKLPNYYIYIKLMIDGTTSKPFSATTFLLEQKEYVNKEEIIKASRSRFSRTRKEVEKEILFRNMTSFREQDGQSNLFMK